MPTTPQAYTVRTFEFACEIVRLYKHLKKIKDFPFPISRQLLRSGTAIGAIVEEAKTGFSDRDLAAKFMLALREARETKYWLRLIVSTDLAPLDLVRDALKESDELCAILHRTVERLRAG